MPQFIATAAIVAVSSTAFAGGLSSEIMAPAASSINPTYIVPGVLAALLMLQQSQTMKLLSHRP